MIVPFGAVLGYQFPELLRVIHFFQVGKLMDDNVVDDGLRYHHELPVEVEVAFPGARSWL